MIEMSVVWIVIVYGGKYFSWYGEGKVEGEVISFDFSFSFDVNLEIFG